VGRSGLHVKFRFRLKLYGPPLPNSVDILQLFERGNMEKCTRTWLPHYLLFTKIVAYENTRIVWPCWNRWQNFHVSVRQRNWCFLNDLDSPLTEILMEIFMRQSGILFWKRPRLLSLPHSLMELSLSWEAANCAATQGLPSILWSPKVHYRVHKSPTLVPILSQIDPVYTIPSCRSEVHFNIVPHLRFGLD
jgi:hypothetical protein